ncbi:sonic hedgehog protein A-like [Limulus polyphemus]|uniref:Hedgehog protein n=1 Tax=Limulus polyphemus TaxID=6850 RepID=A0ABM1T8K9_LIMPO|nr:sonic hedgehog protein A-like [Limulus polyphemus]
MNMLIPLLNRETSWSGGCYRTRWKRTSLLLLTVLLLTETASGCGPGRSGYRRRVDHRLTPLVFKQHIPNVSEKTLTASGLPEKSISRDDPRFKDLVPNYNQDIVFKDEEGTGADRLMTRRCKEKLDTLAISVMNEWPGVKVRVTEAWDEERFHASESLHYEGRAVDITTNDRDRTKYGTLARLAVEAGFDWVYYESRSHIHCSVKSESTDEARSGGCFHGNGVVTTRKGLLRLSEVRVGDEVLAVDRFGHPVFSEVLLFLDRDTESKRQFYVIVTEEGIKITLTPNHLIYLVTANSSVENMSNSSVTYARNVEPGDFIYVHMRTAQHELQLQRVKHVNVRTDVGVVAPLTREGNLIVDNVLASCYAIIDDQSLAHWSFGPVRLIKNLKDSIFHILQRLHILSERTVLNKRDKSHQKGIHWYAELLYSVAPYVLPKVNLYD